MAMGDRHVLQLRESHLARDPTCDNWTCDGHMGGDRWTYQVMLAPTAGRELAYGGMAALLLAMRNN